MLCYVCAERENRSVEVEVPVRVYANGRASLVIGGGREVTLVLGDSRDLGAPHVVTMRGRLPLPPEPVEVTADVEAPGE